MYNLGEGVHCVLTRNSVFTNISFRQYKQFLGNPKWYPTMDGTQLLGVQYKRFADFADNVMTGLPDATPGETVIISKDLGYGKSVNVSMATNFADLSPYVIKIDGARQDGKPFTFELTWSQFLAWYKIRETVNRKIKEMCDDDDAPAPKKARSSSSASTIDLDAVIENKTMYESLAALLLFKLASKELKCEGCENDWPSQRDHECLMADFKGFNIAVHCDLQADRLIEKAQWISDVFDIVSIEFVKKTGFIDYTHEWSRYYLGSDQGRRELVEKALAYKGDSFENIDAKKCQLISLMFDYISAKDE